MKDTTCCGLGSGRLSPAPLVVAMSVDDRPHTALVLRMSCQDFGELLPDDG
jgi:hypothetical protein